MKFRRFIIFLLITVSYFPGLVAGQSLPSPEEVFGFRMGSDRKLIDWNQVVSYFTALDKGSERIVVRELGKTTLGRPFLLAIISSADNIGNLDRYQSIHREIANPYDLSEEEAGALIDEGKVVVLVSLNIHSSEIGSSQESVELAYELVMRSDPKTQKILDNVILLLIPSLNPDGLQMVVDWYRKHVGTPHEGCRMPWLYHHYAGHDNNRDWFMFNLQESRLAAPILYHKWFPEIVYDQHQMGSTGARIFVPPYIDPVNLNVHPILMAEINMLGKHVVADMHAQGFKGVVTGRGYNAFFEGIMGRTPIWHNMLGILTEAASVRVATPIFLPRGSLRQYGPELPRYSHVTDFLDPWEGGWWRLRDIIEYEKAATYSILDLAATYKNKFMTNFYKMNVDAIHRGKTEPPFAYIVPLNQHDPSSAREMLKRLELNGVRIFRSQSPFIYDGRTYAEDTYVIPLSQPCRPCIKDLLERQVYPNLKQYPGGPPKPPYDHTGWTLPMLMGVTVVEMKTPLSTKISFTEDYSFGYSDELNHSAKTFLIERRYSDSFSILNELLKEDAEIFWADRSFSAGNEEYPAGTILIPRQKEISSSLQRLSEEYSVPIHSVDDPIPVKGSRIHHPRLGIYQPWTASMDEGWTRLVLDMYKFSYRPLHNGDIKDGKLSDKYDVIILPDISTEGIIDGRSRRRGEPILGDAEIPKQYQGGIGKEGIEALMNFVKRGGTLITIEAATEFAIEKLKVPAVNVLKGVDRKEYYTPGTLLQIELDTSQPLAYGMVKNPAIRVNNSPAFRLLPYIREIKAVGYYTDENPLLSGWLIGPEKIVGQTVLTEIPVEKGRVIMFGFGVQRRAQTFGTFKLLFNAIYTSHIETVETLEVVTK